MKTSLDANLEEITIRLSQSVISKSAVPSWSDLHKSSLENRMSSELLSLPLKNRNEVHEEVHGVCCLAPEETPTLLATSLKKLAETLQDDNVIPIDEKRAYLESQIYADTYVNEPQFRLRFLRFALFDTTKAARRMVKTLEVLRLLYGDFALRRPIRLSDLSHKEKQYLRNGYFQLLPFRDQSGRRVTFFYLETVQSPVENTMRAKVWLYLNWTAGYDVDTQRKGIIMLLFFNREYSLVFNGTMKYFPNIPMIRTCAMHVCTPDTPSFQLVQKFFFFLMLRDNRPRLKAHIGELVETTYALQSYGIPIADLPFASSGTIKTKAIKQWMRFRETVESHHCTEDFNYFDIKLMNHIPLNITDCPHLNDVLFRQGVSTTTYPGNYRVRAIFQEKHQETKRRVLIQEIIEEVGKNHGRFLVWNESGWWDQLRTTIDSERVVRKIEYMLKDFRRSMRKSESSATNQVKLDSSTCAFQSQNENATSDGCCFEKRKRMKIDDSSDYCL